MSVLKNKRRRSTAIFVNIADDIYTETMAFVLHLPKRYSGLLSNGVINLAMDIANYCEKANSIFPSGDIEKTMRKQYLIEAKASLSAIDVHLSRVYDILVKNPEGCFADSKGKILDSEKAMKKIDNMSQSLGEKIADLERILTSLLKSDAKR